MFAPQALRLSLAAPLVALAAACYPPPVVAHVPVGSAEFRASYFAPEERAAPKARCFEALVAALKSEEYTIELADLDTGRVVTGKRKYTVNATRSGGTSHVELSGAGPSVSGEVENAPQSFVMEQAIKIDFVVEGTDTACKVTATQVRAWNGVEALEEVQPEGGEWARRHLRDPIFAAMKERLP